MKVGIIHLTDIHFSESKNWIDDKISPIVSASIEYIKNVSNAYIIVTGDITNNGKTKEYFIAELFFNKLKATLERFCPATKFKFIMVPGNHDCNFDYDTQSRKNNINGMDYSKIGEDESVTNSSMSVQKDYWKFYEKFNLSPSSRLFYQIEDIVGDTTILFNCYNTAWMSEINEKHGMLFFPIKSIIKEPLKKANGINIALFHHPLSWFNPSTEKNNRKEFKKHLEENSSILIYGHEHEEEHLKNQDISTKQETIYISGNALQNNTINSSGFQTIIIDLEIKEGNIKNYNWYKSLYILGAEKPFKINCCKYWHKDFNHQNEFLKRLNTLSLPLKFENKEKITLSDIYIFPDLEKITKEEKKIDDPYYDSEKLLTEQNLKTIIIEGESQSGKSSLINMLYLKFADFNKYPLFIEASDFKKLDFDKVIQKAFENQYSTADNLTYETFKQYNVEEKILFVDNLQDLNFNSKTVVTVIKELQSRFTHIIIGTSSIYAYLSAIKSEFEDIDCYTIKSLGFKKRNDLIEKYHKLNESSLTVTDQIILEKTKHSFDQVQLVLGNKLIPSYPVYVLSILQSLNYATPYNLEQTSFGYCYQALIYIALANKASVKNEDIDSYFNFLVELAFNLYEREKVVINETDLSSFYDLYSKKFITKPLAEIKTNLLLSNIFVNEDDVYFKFGYNYIFYFLIAKKIAEIIATEQGKAIVNKLCGNLHNEKNANILIFTAHHSKDDYLIDEATFASMVPFDKLEPITLKRDDNFYDLIEGIVKQVSSDIIKSDKNPREERKKMLDEQDKDQHKIDKTKNDKDEVDEVDEPLRPMFQAFRAIEIVGQIVKNRKGSIEKEKLVSIVTELYYTAFRTISFFGGIYNDTKEDFAISLKNRIENGDTKHEIEEKINSFFQYICFQACLCMFSKLVYSVGNKDLRNLFEQVSTNINTPAAKLVTFSIKTYYDRMSGRELQALAKEFADNPVALSILKARVRSYIYNNNIDYKTKQKIAEALKMKIIAR
jgi:predicted MPP superfamily phosphohydrolase